jgi:hypothetical protein
MRFRRIVSAHKIRAMSACASALVGIAVSILAIRANFGGNDYIEWHSSGFQRPPPEPGPAFEEWERARWGVQLRANPDGLFCFGSQPFFGYPRNGFNLHIPYWLAIPITMVLPVYATVRWRQGERLKRRVANNLCPACGYDLRASTERCPECGTPIPPRARPTDPKTG